ncbi:unannotated protein [freshwater metagenome]|uniref:Unannotated protein n=1 Tax=freshwater metagenome TaxID=449393 RepID=A0A6J6VIJ2_9ZZZZ
MPDPDRPLPRDDASSHPSGRPSDDPDALVPPGSDLVARLRSRWPLDDADDLRDELLAAWDRPGYHDLRHLAEVLARVEELAAAGIGFGRMQVSLAAWFHDAVYDGERDAEERSAVWAERSLPSYAGEPVAAEVARLVRMTETHDPAPEDVEGCVLSDADLAVLACGQDRYAAYVAGVREEYAHLDEETFRRGRAQVLASLAERPALFRTDHARDRWEAAARANLAAELAALGGVGSAPG